MMFADLVLLGIVLAAGYIWGRNDKDAIEAGRQPEDEGESQDFASKLRRSRESQTDERPTANQ